jgi:hypothetical protein
MAWVDGTELLRVIFKCRRNISFEARPRNSEKPPLASSCPSVCPATWNKLGSHWTDFHVFCYLSISGKPAKKIQVSLESQKNDGYFTRRPMYTFYNVFLEREMFQTAVVEQIKTHIWCSKLFSKNRVVFEITWKKYCRAGQATDDNKTHAHWMPDT